MSLMLAKTYTALREAGAPDDVAREAAEEIAGYERRLMRVEMKLNVLLAGTGTVIAGVALLVIRLFVGGG